MRPALIACVTGLGLVVSAASLGPLGAQSRQPLSDADRTLAQRVESSAFLGLRDNPAAFFREKALSRLRDTPAGREARSVITQINPVAPSRVGGPRGALVSRYDYPTGLTFQTFVDLAAERAIDTKADFNFPTPLAPEERRHAVALGAKVVPALATAPPEQAETLPLIDTAQTSATYGHRLVVVWRAGAEPSERLLVDLTMDAVAKRNY